VKWRFVSDLGALRAVSSKKANNQGREDMEPDSLAIFVRPSLYCSAVASEEVGLAFVGRLDQSVCPACPCVISAFGRAGSGFRSPFPGKITTGRHLRLGNQEP